MREVFSSSKSKVPLKISWLMWFSHLFHKYNWTLMLLTSYFSFMWLWD